MKFYEFAPTRSMRVRWVLQELGVEFEAISINLLAGEHRPPLNHSPETTHSY
ncbi:hypothetical protein [Phormidesmis priestleyi]